MSQWGYVCPVCGKEFFIQCLPREYGYKRNGQLFCRYNCMLKFDKDHEQEFKLKKIVEMPGRSKRIVRMKNAGVNTGEIAAEFGMSCARIN